jgi:hypothetical protein
MNSQPSVMYDIVLLSMRGWVYSLAVAHPARYMVWCGVVYAPNIASQH